MRGFEVLDIEDKELKLDASNVIGMIIIDVLKVFVILTYDKTRPCGLRTLQ